MRPLGLLPVSYAAQGEKSSPRFAAAFSQGCKGPVTPDLSRLKPGAFAAFCTPSVWHLLEDAQADGRDWYYGDHGFFRRFQYYRITKNCYQHDGRTVINGPERFQALRLETQPGWNTGGSAIVICPNSSQYMARFGVDANEWAFSLIRQLRAVSDRPIVLRWKSHAQRRPLYLDLHDAWMVITFSSAAAIEALMHGVPICTTAPWASTAHMGITNPSLVETPYYPTIEERDRFLWSLAEQQWTLAEITDGLAWKTLRGAA